MQEGGWLRLEIQSHRSKILPKELGSAQLQVAATSSNGLDDRRAVEAPAAFLCFLTPRGVQYGREGLVNANASASCS